MKYQAYTLKNLHHMPRLSHLPEEMIHDMNVVGRVFPFKTNNYVADELIDWDHYATDPLFALNFPQKKMLGKEHYDEISGLLTPDATDSVIEQAVGRVRCALNPHPAGQMEHNVPKVDGLSLSGIQHKYRETMLVFPSQGQTCHAFCSFCFRWPQFVGMKDYRFALKQADRMVGYLKEHPEITDVLLTGGDPMVMSTEKLDVYISALLSANLPNLQTIRIGTKSLSFWPYRFLTDKDAGALLDLFKRVTDSGMHLSIMAHINHYAEMSTDAFREAVKRIRETGANIRSQSPVLKGINDHSDIWVRMWKEQVKLGIVPYYMFVARNTGAHRFFSVPLVKTYEIYREAYARVSGVARTVRGPSMSATPGKIKVDGVANLNGKKLIVLSFMQGRNPDWVKRPFFAEYSDQAVWLRDLKPAFGEKSFFFEKSQ